MSKGKLTREMILSKSASLFNSRGYFGASMSDVMNATGLEKGGIYNHFKSKDELAMAAFDHVISVNSSIIKEYMDAAETPLDKLVAFVDGFKAVIADPPYAGGCPLLNCAAESDDTHPALRAKVRLAVKKVLRALEALVESGMSVGQLRSDLEPLVVAQFLFASIEGGVLLTKLYDDPKRMDVVADQLKKYIRACASNV
jgi:TetR/AcrR family transcriptional regulator, transcriptional repressor for nem operon